MWGACLDSVAFVYAHATWQRVVRIFSAWAIISVHVNVGHSCAGLRHPKTQLTKRRKRAYGVAADRAEYGERLLERLAEALRLKGVSRVDIRELRRCRRFYLAYPHIRESLTPELRRLLPAKFTDIRKLRESVTPALGADGKTLIARLSFTQLAELIELDDPLKRAFCEVECIRGNWSVRALKRQIATLYFERSGLSTHKEKLAALAQAVAEQPSPNWPSATHTFSNFSAYDRGRR
jgi:DUF1016 N-terminal domain